MSKHPVIQKFEKERMKKKLPVLHPGDTVIVQTKILEEGGKERLQSFTGTLIAKNGSGASQTITLHRIAYGEGMQRVFFIHSPLVAKIEVSKRGKVRRAKLNYLKGSSGKASKVKSRYEAVVVEEENTVAHVAK